MKEEIYRCEVAFAKRFSRGGSVPLTDGWRLMFGQYGHDGAWRLFATQPFQPPLLLVDAPLWIRKAASRSLRDLFHHLLWVDRDIEETTAAFKLFADQETEGDPA